MNILIAEDDYISRKFLYTVLAAHGTVKLACNGREAVDMYLKSLSESRPFDLVCLDIMMPEMDGVEALKAIRAIESEWPGSGLKQAKIVMTTALADKPFVIKALKYGCDGYVLKPIDQKVLFQKMTELELTLTSCPS